MDIPTTAAGAIGGAVIALVTLTLWLLKRRSERSPQQRMDDQVAQLDRLEREILEDRRAGRDADADAKLRRLRELSRVAIGLGGDASPGQRDPGNAPGGNPDPGQKRDGVGSAGGAPQ